MIQTSRVRRAPFVAIARGLAVVVALLVAMLAAGRGLPGLVEAMKGVPTHVCTCAQGGDHAACPICNPQLKEHRRSLAPAVQRVPCGDARVAVGAPDEVGTMRPTLLSVAPSRTWLRAPRPESIAVPQVIPEPSTPPPRNAST